MKRVVSSIVVLVGSLLMNGGIFLDDDYDEYEMTKYQVESFLNYYKEYFTEEILDHKYMEQEIKRELVYGYNKLKEEDKEPYREFINHVISGGIPKVVSNKKSYIFNSDDVIDLYSLIVVTDSEDGNIILNSDNTKIDTDLNMDVPGIYEIKFTINDSDNNIITYSIYIIINKVYNNTDNNTNNNTNYYIKKEDKEKVVIDKKEDYFKPVVPNTGV